MTPIPFGIHEGRTVAEAPADYLLWLCSAWSVRRSHPALLTEAVDELQRRLDADKGALLESLRLPERSRKAAGVRRQK